MVALSTLIQTKPLKAVGLDVFPSAEVGLVFGRQRRKATYKYHTAQPYA